jgi:hypothetical protein
MINEVAREKTGIKDIAMEQKWRWAGHVARYDEERISKQIEKWELSSRTLKTKNQTSSSILTVIKNDGPMWNQKYTLRKKNVCCVKFHLLLTDQEQHLIHHSLFRPYACDRCPSVLCEPKELENHYKNCLIGNKINGKDVTRKKVNIWIETWCLRSFKRSRVGILLWFLSLKTHQIAYVVPLRTESTVEDEAYKWIKNKKERY